MSFLRVFCGLKVRHRYHPLRTLSDRAAESSNQSSLRTETEIPKTNEIFSRSLDRPETTYYTSGH